MQKIKKRNWSDEDFDEDNERMMKRSTAQDRRNKRKQKAIRLNDLDKLMDTD